MKTLGGRDPHRSMVACRQRRPHARRARGDVGHRDLFSLRSTDPGSIRAHRVPRPIHLLAAACAVGDHLGLLERHHPVSHHLSIASPGHITDPTSHSEHDNRSAVAAIGDAFAVGRLG